MRSYIKNGYSHADVVDYALANCNKGFNRKTNGSLGANEHRSSLRRPIFTHLATVRDHLTYAQKYCAGGVMPGYYDRDDHVRIARDHLRKAREWRNEIGG